MKKIAVVNSSPLTNTYGGVSSFMNNLDPFLRSEFELTYIDLPHFLHKIDFIPRRLLYGLYLLSKINKISKYDFILSHVPEGSFICSLTNTPFIHIFHGNSNPMSISRFWYGKYFKIIFKIFDKRIIKCAKLKYTVGNERNGIPKIYNPIYHSVKVKEVDKRNGFIFAGRLEKAKNIDKIIEAYSCLPEKILSTHSLYIAGFGSLEKYLKSLVSKLDLNEKVVFLGNFNNLDLIELISTKKLLLMASSWEGLPMAIAESLSVGVPVVSTDAGDISRVIKNSYNGFLLKTKFGNNEYAEKIESVLKNYNFFAANALKSSELFKAKTVAQSLIRDINNL